MGLSVLSLAKGEPDKSEHHKDGPGYNQPMRISHRGDGMRHFVFAFSPISTSRRILPVGPWEQPFKRFDSYEGIGFQATGRFCQSVLTHAMVFHLADAATGRLGKSGRGAWWAMAIAAGAAA
jgi:hypothetical protein